MHATNSSQLLNYADTGRGPAILLLHADVNNHSFLSARLDLLGSCGHRVIVANPARSTTSADALLELLNFLGLGRVLVIACAHEQVAQALQQQAPERVVGITLVGADSGCVALEQALTQASRTAQARRTPLQQLNRRLSGLFQAFLPPADDGADEVLREQG